MKAIVILISLATATLWKEIISHDYYHEKGLSLQFYVAIYIVTGLNLLISAYFIEINKYLEKQVLKQFIYICLLYIYGEITFFFLMKIEFNFSSILFLNFFAGAIVSLIISIIPIIIPIVIGGIMADIKKINEIRREKEIKNQSFQKAYSKESKDWQEREEMLEMETKYKLSKDMDWLQERVDENFLKYRSRF